MRITSMLATFTSMLLVSMTLAQPDPGPPPPPPPGPPGPADVKVEWEAGYPKKEDGKLKLKGKVTFANGWSSANGKLFITIAPTAGGLVIARIKNIAENGTWEDEIDLSTFPMPKQDYDITPSVQAWKGQGTMAYAVTGPRKTMELP
jgi:hypothetical protein